MKSDKVISVDAYISGFPPKTQALLKEMRNLIRQAAPKAEEVISYNMPAFKQDGMLVYYAGNKAHIGFYPTASPIKFFKNELTAYKTSKGAIQFPVEEGIPAALVKKIVKFRISENKEKQKLKAKNK